MQKEVTKSIRQVMASILITTTLLLYLAGCGSSSQTSSSSTLENGTADKTTTDQTPAKKVTVAFWNSFTGSDGETLKEIVKQFNEKNKDKVEVKMDIMAADVFGQKVPPSIATGTAPDFITLTPSDIIAYSKKGSIEDISDFYTQDGVKKDDFTAASLDMSTVDSKQYGVPMQMFSSTFMYWNKDLFKAAGLDPEAPPKDFDELANVAVKLTDSGKNQFGLAMPTKSAPLFLVSFIRGNGGEAVDMATKKSVLASDVNIKTFEYLRTLAYTDKVTPKSTNGVDMDNLMLSNKIGIYFCGPWLIPGLKSHNINYGVTLPPKGSVCQSSVLEGTLYAVPKGTEDTQKVGVYEFLKYWNSTEIGKKWSTTIGFPPYLNSVIDDPEIKANKDISAMSTGIDGVAKTWNIGLTSASKIDADILFPLVEQLQNGADATEAAKKASDQIDALLAEEK